jgi:hypothetical protein
MLKIRFPKIEKRLVGIVFDQDYSKDPRLPMAYEEWETRISGFSKLSPEEIHIFRVPIWENRPK